VTDARQGMGVGTELLRRLVAVARAEGVATLSAEMRADNDGMRRAAEKVGFDLRPRPSEGVVRAEMRLE
jgi:acetyltransferase